ncbi:MAG: type II toxin-antitoxin system VapC family toxin [Gemmatimonadota bacterium]
MRFLLDTHVLVEWFEESSRLGPRHAALLQSADVGHPLWVSDISLWEVANLVGLGRIEIGIPLRDWLERSTAPPLVRRIGISPVVAAEVAALPDTLHRDPADRIIIACARVLGATVLTRDRRIIESGLVQIA